MMKQFAVFYIPSNKNFYKTGSRIIGYDILSQLVMSDLNNPYSIMMKTMNSKSKTYGFHLTLTDVVDIQKRQLDKAIKRAKIIFRLPFLNKTKIIKKKIGVMPNADTLAIQYINSFRLFLLHVLLVCFVQRKGNRSDYSDSQNTFKLFQKVKIKLFHSPYILDEFLPHISLVSNFNLKTNNILYHHLCKIFNDHEQIELDRIAIVVKDSGDNYFKIKEFLT